MSASINDLKIIREKFMCLHKATANARFELPTLKIARGEQHMVLDIITN